MKKNLLLTLTVALCVGVSTTCFAGFGLPKVPGTSKESKPAASASKESASAVDLTDITNKQGNIIKYMCGGLYAQLRAYQVVDEATGNADPELAQVQEGLKKKNNAAIKKAQSVLEKKQKAMSAQQKADVQKNEEQVAKLAQAIKSGKAYQQAAIINYGVVAAQAPGALKEATSAVKNLTKDPMAANKVNGAISTYKIGVELSGKAQAVSSAYEKNVGALKSEYGVTEEALNKASSPDVNAIANECLDFVNGK